MNDQLSLYQKHFNRYNQLADKPVDISTGLSEEEQ